jgi:hypothetical protein
MMQLIPVNVSQLHDREIYEASLKLSTTLACAAPDSFRIATPERVTELAVLLLTTVQGCSCGYVIPAEGPMMQVQPALVAYNLTTFRSLLGGWCQPGPRNEGTPWHHRHRLVIREQEDIRDQPINPLASLIAGTVVRGMACFVPISQIDRALYKAPRWKSANPINLELPFSEASALTG